MNAKKFSDAMSELDTKYVDEALSYDKSRISKVRPQKLGILIAAVIAVLALCGFAAYELGLFDPWFQKPSTDPVQTVQSAIEGQAGKEYTISVRVDEIKVDESETERVIEMYSGSDLAKERGWTDEYLAEHFVVVWAKYYVEYDHTKTFMDDGYTEQYFYLAQDGKTGIWEIVDNTTPNTSKDLLHEESNDSTDNILNSSELTEFSFEGTIFHYGEHSYDVTSRAEAINSILSVIPVGEKIVIECHVGPANGVYCIFNTVSESFETDIFGNHLIWHSDDITTAVYSFWSDVYTYDGEIIKSYDLDGNAFIYDLTYSDDHSKLNVTILCDDGTEEIDIIDL